MENKRVYYIDCLRVFASFLVVLIHCNFIPENPDNKIYTQLLNVLGAPSSELFLAISGSLLIPVTVPDKVFYKKRFTRLAIPLIFWSLFGILWLLIVENISFTRVLYLLFSIPFKSQIVGPYWFMYAIIGMYLVAPIITPYIINASKKKIFFILFLWGLSLLMPYTNIMYPDFYNVDGDFSSPLYNFSGYLGYMILGYYLRKYPLSLPGGIVSIIFLYGLTLVPIILVGYYCPSERQYVLSNLQILSALQVAIIFTLFQKVFMNKNRITEVARFITNYTFGIYLIHVFVIKGLYMILGGPEKYPVIMELPLIIILGFGMSFLLVFMTSKIACLKTVLGVK